MRIEFLCDDGNIFYEKNFCESINSRIINNERFLADIWITSDEKKISFTVEI